MRSPRPPLSISPYDEISVYVSYPTTNTVSIEPDEVWSTGQFHAVVSKA